MLDWLIQQKGVGLLVFDILLCATGWKHWSTWGGSQAVSFYLSEQYQKSPESPQDSLSSIMLEEENPNADREKKENKKYYLRRT